MDCFILSAKRGNEPYPISVTMYDADQGIPAYIHITQSTQDPLIKPNRYSILFVPIVAMSQTASPNTDT